MPRLTQPTLAKLKRPITGRREVSDNGGSLRLCLYPSGRASWIMRFHLNGRSAKLTLGPADLRPDAKDAGSPPFTLAAARALAADVQRRRAGGAVVIPVREAATPTFEHVARRYVDEHVRPKNRTWRETASVLGFTLMNLRSCAVDWRIAGATGR